MPTPAHPRDGWQPCPVRRWAVLWRSDNRLDGETRRVMWNCGEPLLFRTKREASAYIRERYGYIARRTDLRREPHGWRMPWPVRASVIIAPEGAA